MNQIMPIAAAFVFLFGGSLAAAQAPNAADLQLEIDALNMMNTAGGPMVADAETRADQMRQFISVQNLDDGWTAYSESGEAPGFKGLTFDQAFSNAMDKQKELGASTPFTDNIGDLQADLAGTKMLVQSQWKKVNALHVQNAALTGFLKTKNKMGAYHEWAQIQAAQRLEQAEADAKHSKEHEEKADKERRETANEHAADLRYSLDQQQQANSSSNDIDDNVYYEDSYYNGYADPYYDVWGHPVARHDHRENRRENHALHKDYNRSNPRPNVAPSRHHRSHGRR